MNYIVEIIWLCWFLSEILLNRLIRSKQPESKVQDRGSLRLIWIAIAVSMTLGILCAIYLRAPVIHSHVLAYFGLAMIVTGMLIRFIAIHTLGRFFTVNLAIHKDQHIVQTGLYGYVRHPSYTGSLLSFTGFALSLNNWISLAVIVIPVLATFLNRIFLEEKMLQQKFGTEYEEYKKKTKRLIPMIY
jgi:protein-S-isoprenylcysteine O-methyltransferase Ste14